MKDYVLTCAPCPAQGYRFSIVSRLWRNWQARKTIKSLAAFDDYMLRDIGLTRDDVHWAVNLPLSVNAGTALEECAFQRGYR